MSSCLRCHKPSAPQSDYCEKCQSFLRNRLQKKDVVSQELLGPSLLKTKSGNRKYSSTSIVEKLLGAVETSFQTNNKPHASHLTPLPVPSSDAELESHSLLSSLATITELPTIVESEQDSSPLEEPLQQLLPDLWTTFVDENIDQDDLPETTELEDEEVLESDPLEFDDEDTVKRKILKPPVEVPIVDTGAEDDTDVWASLTDPLVKRRLPNSVESASIEEEDIRLAIDQGEIVTIKYPSAYSAAIQEPVRSRLILPVRMRVLFIALAIVTVIATIVDGIIISHGITRTPDETLVPTTPILTLTPSSVHPGQIVNLHLNHFSNSTSVFLTHDIQEAVRTDVNSPFIRLGASGNADIRILAESSWGAGFHMIEAEDVKTHYTASATLQIIGDVPLRSPHLQLSRSILNMGADLQGANTIQSLLLRNTGGSWISWIANSDSPWLVVSPSQGIFRDSQSIFVAISRANLKPGNYTGTITFISNTDIPISIQVKMTVLPLPTVAYAVMVVTPPALSFTATDGGIDPTSQLLKLSNPGSKALNWSFTINNLTVADNQILPSEYDGNWLTTDIASGSVPPGSTETVHIIVHSHTLLPSVYSGIFMFTSAQNALNNPQPMAVSLTLQPRCGVATSLGGMAFTTSSNRDNPASQVLDLSTTLGCTDTINWQSYSSASWLNVTPTTGQLHGNTNTMTTVRVNANSLNPGTYNGFLVFLTDQRAQTVMVQLTILTTSLSSSPSVVIVGQPTPQCIAVLQTCTIQQPGGTPLPGSGSPPPLPGSGTPLPLPSPGPGTPFPTPVPATPTPGPGTPPPSAPVMSMSSLNLNFRATHGQGNPPGQNVTIANTGGSSLYWQATTSSSASTWLSIGPLGGTIAANQTGQIRVNVDTTGLKTGTYTAQITVTATDGSGTQVEGSPQSLTVKLYILQPCTLQVSPTSLFFTSTPLQPNPPSQRFTLKGSGNCAFPISWTATVDNASSNWLSVSASSGKDNGNGSTITVSVNANGLLPNVYSGWVSVNASDSNGTNLKNTPQYVSVSLTVV